MKLKTKISIITLLIWTTMATLFYYGSHRIFMNSYVQLENQTIDDTLDRTEAQLNQVIYSLAESTQDWAIWDDTYQFVKDKNSKYIKSTLAVSSFQSIKIDIMLFFDTHGKLFYEMAVNRDRTETIPLPEGLMSQLTPDSLPVHLPTIDSSAQGMISIPNGILLIAAHSITDSDKNGSPRGSLIIGRYLTDSVLAKIEHLVKADDTIFRLPNTYHNTEIVPVIQQLEKGEYSVFVKKEHRLLGYRYLKDINNNPIAILKVEIPRTIYQLGVTTTHYSNLIVFIYSFIITFTLWMLLQYLIVKRIEGLSKHIGNMGSDKRMLTKLIENVSDEVSSVAALYHHATHDPLTGLANRNLLYQAFSSFSTDLTRLSNKIVLLFIDLDHFKRFNDTLGHDVGDEILIATAKRLTESLRGDDLAARLGGDEFVVMLTDIENEQIESITNRIFKIINQPIMINNHEVYITCSVGVCVYPDDGLTIEKLIKQADMALYHAKEEGRNRYQFYSEALSHAILETHQKEIALQNALVKNEFVLHYQPIFDLRTKQIASLEALIRWNHPTKGLLGSSEIIPFAEQSDIINPIGEWVLNEVCRQLHEWKSKNIPLVPVAINISSEQLNRTGLSEKIIKKIQNEDISANLIQYEITETGFIEITPKLINELAILNAFGIKLIIDDFGTGYSGLGYLKTLPVGKLKIDQSFIRDLQTDPDDKAITLAIIAIAHELNLRVTAEGIENVAQYNFMCHYQVDEVQGHFLSEPLCAEDCEKVLSGERPLGNTV